MADSWLLDASALIAALEGEPGGDRVEAAIAAGAAMSAVNYAEVHQHLSRKGYDSDLIAGDLDGLDLFVVPFDRAAAHECGALVRATAQSGLGIANRACLATARLAGFDVLTADRTWGGVEVGVKIELIR